MRILELSTEESVQRLYIDPLASYLRVRGHTVYQKHGFRRSLSLMDLASMARVWVWLKKWDIDVLHVQTAKAGGIGRIAAWLAGTKRVVYTMHDVPFHDQLPLWRRRLYRRLEWLLAHLCQVITMDSPAGKNRAITAGLAPARKIHVIPVGVETAWFHPIPKAFETTIVVVGTVARLVPDKGIDRFLRILAVLKMGRIPVRGVIVGDGPLRRELEALARHLGLATLVTFRGEQRDVRTELALMDIFVLPTKREGLSVAVMEAMSMALPVVVSDIPAFRYLVRHNETGLVARPHEWTSHIGTLLHSAERRQTLGLEARAHVQKYYEQSVCNRAYERVLVG